MWVFFMQVIPLTGVCRLTELQETGLLVHLNSSQAHYGQLNFQSPPCAGPNTVYFKKSYSPGRQLALISGC